MQKGWLGRREGGKIILTLTTTKVSASGCRVTRWKGDDDDDDE